MLLGRKDDAQLAAGIALEIVGVAKTVLGCDVRIIAVCRQHHIGFAVLRGGLFPEFYDRLFECFPYIDAQRRLWPEFDSEKLIDKYAKDGFDGASRFIDEYLIGDRRKTEARAYVNKFRKKHLTDPHGYPVSWLIRNLMLNEIDVNSPTPVGPKTKAYAVRAIEMERADVYEDEN